jgi:Zn-dependent protease with chaperone function
MLPAVAARAQLERRRGGVSNTSDAQPQPGQATDQSANANTSAAAETSTRERVPSRARDVDDGPRGGSLLGVLIFLAIVTTIPLLTWFVAEAFRNAPPTPRTPMGIGANPVDRETVRQIAALTANGSLIAIVLGPALALFITLASWLGGRSRVLLLALFMPGLYLTLGGLAVLMALQGGVILGTLYLLLLTGAGIPPLVIIPVGLFTFFGVLALLNAMLNSIQRARIGVFGLPLQEQEAPGLWQHVRELAERMRAGAPRQIVAGIDPGFWVTEAEVHSLAGKHTGRTLYLSLPMTRLLAKDELSAILAHELAHFRGFDTRFSQLFYPVYRGAGQSLAWIDHQTDESMWSWLTLLPAQVVLEYFYWCFAAAEGRVSRSRELAADRASAEATSPRNAAAALVKAHAFDGFWGPVRGRMRGAFTRGERLANVSTLYVEVVRAGAVPSILEGLADQRLTHPTDSHPPLHARLTALGISLEEVGGAALAVTPVTPAVAWIDGAEAIEQRLSADIPDDAAF